MISRSQSTDAVDPGDDIGADAFIAHGYVTHGTLVAPAADQSAQISVTEADAGRSDVTSTRRKQLYDALPPVESDRSRSTVESSRGAAELRKRQLELGLRLGFRLGQQR